jgi:hypothetical protein
VTVLLHDADFSDLSACTFWLAPGAPLSTFTVRTFATKAWSNATVSVYPSTVGLDQWIRLDNVSLRQTPGTTIVGTECLEPGSSIVAPPPDPQPPAANPAAPTGATSIVDRLMLLPIVIGADNGYRRLAVDVWFALLLSPVDVEISLDGVTWQVIGTIPGSSPWGRIEIDLSEWAGQAVYVRIVVRPTK